MEVVGEERGADLYYPARAYKSTPGVETKKTMLPTTKGRKCV